MQKVEKVLFVQKWFSLSGGVERVNLNLSHAFERFDITSEFYIFDISGEKLAGFKELEKKRKVTASVQYGNFFKKLKHFIHFIKTNKITSIISATETANIYVCIASFLVPSLTIIYTRHCAFEVSDQKLSPLKIKLLYNIYALSGGKIGGVSQALADEIKCALFINKKNSMFLPNAVFDNKIDSLSHVNSDNVDYGKYFVAIGRLVEQKGFDNLIDAYASAFYQNPNIPKLVIVGIGPDEEKLKAQVQDKQIVDKVVFHGFTKNPYYLLKHSEAFLLSSRHEGMPTVIVESLYLKTPVISFDCPTGPNELIKNGQNGLLIKNQDVGAFTDALLSFNASSFSDIDNTNVQKFGFDNIKSTYLKELGLGK